MTGARTRAAGIAVLVAVIGFATAGATFAGDGLRATLDGRPIPISRVGQLNCHDFDYPVIRCFSSPDALSADIESRLSSSATGAFLLLSGFVTAYEHDNYGGASISLSTDQPSLSSIGWNDRISSFKSFGATGRFREDSPAGGFTYVFGATAQVSSLGGTYNDKFSALYIP
jgi:hypothetical protein